MLYIILNHLAALYMRVMCMYSFIVTNKSKLTRFSNYSSDKSLGLLPPKHKPKKKLKLRNNKKNPTTCC